MHLCLYNIFCNQLPVYNWHSYMIVDVCINVCMHACMHVDKMYIYVSKNIFLCMRTHSCVHLFLVASWMFAAWLGLHGLRK